MLQNHEKKEDTDITATCSTIKRELQTPNLSANASFLSAPTQLARCKLHWIRYISFQVFIISFFLNFSQRKQCKEKPNNTHWLANHFKYLQQRLDVKVLFSFDYGWSESQTVPQRNICDSGIAIQMFVTKVHFLFYRKHVHHTHTNFIHCTIWTSPSLPLSPTIIIVKNLSVEIINKVNTVHKHRETAWHNYEYKQSFYYYLTVYSYFSFYCNMNWLNLNIK